MSEPLTAAEAYNLPEGTPITVTWSGGNGPHDYFVAVDEHGHRYAALNLDSEDAMRWYNLLRFVGQESFNTRVWMREA